MDEFRVDLPLLFEIGSMRRIVRAWSRFMGKWIQNDAEHTFRVVWTALVLARHEGLPSSSDATLIKMALVHDMGEIRAGDCDITLKRYAMRDERAAVHDMFAGSSLSEFAAIYDEYEKFESPEARIVRDADLIESDLETREEQLMGNAGADYTFADKRRTGRREKFFTESARLLHDAILGSAPEDFYGRHHLRTP